MTYAIQELSIQDGAPYFLYEFNSPTFTYRYTDNPTNLTWNSQTWNSFPIKHSEAKQSNELSKNSMQITIPKEGDLGSKYVGWSPDEVVTFTLYRGQHGSTDTRVNWKGRVAGHKLKQAWVELNCESIFTSMRRSGVRARYQRMCRHALYQPGCNVVKEDFALVGAVMASMSGLNITIADAALQASGWYTGGAILFSDGSYRMIVAHSGTTITIDRSSRILDDTIASGTEVATLYPGCDRTLATCKNKYHNLVNNGAFQAIPGKNPMGGSSIL